MQSPRETWEERYGVDDYVFGTEPNDFLRETVVDRAPGRALCIAEGEGRNAVHLASLGWSVMSFDLTDAGVHKTGALAAARGVEVDAHVADAAAFDLGEDAWDLIVSIFAHMPPPIRRDLHRRVVKALRPGGVFVLEAYRPAQIGRGTGGPPVAEMMMTAAELAEELAGLEMEHLVEIDRSVIEGSGHTGDAAVVQVVARRPRSDAR